MRSSRCLGGGGFKALYVTPLRSLNRDILMRMEWWCHELGLTVGVRHGDTPMGERRKQALSPPDLLITTPETLQALFMGKRLRKHLEHVKFVIIDDIHEMAGSKRGAQSTVALERLGEYTGEFQRIGLSATVGNPETIGRFLCGDRPCEIVQVPVAKQLDITVSFVGDDFKHQVHALDRLLGHEGSTLVFVNTRVTAEALGHALYPGATWRCTTGRSQRRSGSMPRSGLRKGRSGPSSAPHPWNSGSISAGLTM